jgi:hypothetical protein
MWIGYIVSTEDSSVFDAHYRTSTLLLALSTSSATEASVHIPDTVIATVLLLLAGHCEPVPVLTAAAAGNPGQQLSSTCQHVQLSCNKVLFSTNSWRSCIAGSIQDSCGWFGSVHDALFGMLTGALWDSMCCRQCHQQDSFFLS